MNITRRRGAIALAITLGVLIIGGIIAFYIPWIILTRSIMLFVLGLILLGLLVTGVVLNTVFLVREVRRNERQDSFLNAVSHELKTPIASLRLYLETLQRRDLPEAQRQDFYRIMLADTGRLLSTVEQVLKAGELSTRSRHHQNRTLLEVEPLVADCIAIALQRYHLSEEALRLEPVPGAVRLRVRGVTEDLRTAILNILDNAVKYSPNGVHVRCSLAIVNYTQVRLTVVDQGIGLPPGQNKHIFKRFYRVPGRMAVKIKGTGIGLFLVRTISRQHGGDVTARSAGPNQGTTITMTLPLATPSPAESVVSRTHAEASQ